MTRTDWLDLLLATTVALRGLGAGFITGVIAITMPTRKRVGLVPYAQFSREGYRGRSPRVYGGVTVLGALLTATVLTMAIWWQASGWVSWLTGSSLVATSLGFVGVAGALPAMFELWRTGDDDLALLERLLGRFERWGKFSCAWHIIAFLLIVSALAVPLW